MSGLVQHLWARTRPRCMIGSRPSAWVLPAACLFGLLADCGGEGDGGTASSTPAPSTEIGKAESTSGAVRASVPWNDRDDFEMRQTTAAVRPRRMADRAAKPLATHTSPLDTPKHLGPWLMSGLDCRARASGGRRVEASPRQLQLVEPIQHLDQHAAPRAGRERQHFGCLSPGGCRPLMAGVEHDELALRGAVSSAPTSRKPGDDTGGRRCFPDGEERWSGWRRAWARPRGRDAAFVAAAPSPRNPP